MSNAATQHDGRPIDQMLQLGVGPMHLRRHGAVGAPLAIGVPGLSANSFSFDALGEALALAGRCLVAVDLRGRGRSPAGPPGSHGWDNHARDVLAIADARGARHFDFIGHSMGAFVGLALANLAPDRLRRLVLVDAVGVPDPRAMPPIVSAVSGLHTVHASVDAFLARVAAGGVVPWGPFWEAHYREDLVEVAGGVAQRAHLATVLEDVAYAAGTQVRELWPGVGVPTLLVRAGVPLAPGGDVITEADRDAFLRTVTTARSVEIAANHYGVMNHERTARAVGEFLQ